MGDERSINVWEDRWPHTPHMPKPTSSKPVGCRITKVADLGNHMGEGLNHELLEQCFNEEEIALISKIPVSSLGARDRLVWKKEKNGQYKVSLGYLAAMRLRNQQKSGVESSATAEDDKILWNRIWGLKVKKKVMHFLWRSINNSLPVQVNLQSRRVKYRDECNLCGEQPESVVHIMLDCPIAIAIWKMSPVLQAPDTNALNEIVVDGIS